jgi:hypothetical protein
MKEDEDKNENEEKLNITVKTLVGTKFNFDVNYKDKIIILKLMLDEKTGIRKDEIRLVHKGTGKAFDDDESMIGDLLNSGDELIMTIKLHGC